MSTTVSDTQSFLEKAIEPKPPVLPPDTALKVTIAPIYGPGASCILRDFESTGQRKAAIGCPQQLVSLTVRLSSAFRGSFAREPDPAPVCGSRRGGIFSRPESLVQRP